MAAKSKIEILLEANDKMTKELKRIGNESKKFTNAFKKSAVELNAKIELIQKALRGLVKLFQLVEKGAKFTQQKQAFNDLARSVGADADDLVSKMREMSGETLSTADIMQNASRAMALGLEASKLPELMEISRAAARAFGQDVSFMFDSIVLGIGRQSKLILDNLGIIVSAKTAYEDMARSLQKNVTQLTEAERKQAFLNAAVKQGRDLVTRINISQRSQLENIQRLKAQWEDFTTALGEFLSESPEVKRAIDTLTEGIQFLIDKMKEMSTGTIGALEKELQQVNDDLESAMKLTDTLQALLGATAVQETKISELLARKKEIILELNELRAEENQLSDEERQNVEDTIQLLQLKQEELRKIRDTALAAFDEQRIAFEVQEEGLTNLLETFQKIQKQAIFSTAQLLSNTLGTLNTGMSKALSSIVLGTKKASEAFKELGQAMIKSIVDYVTQFIISQTIAKALSAAMSKFVIAQAAAIANAWAPAAYLASVATLGGAAATGGTAAAAGALGFQGFIAGITSALQVPGLQDGGIVPATPGGRLIRVGEGGQDEAIIPLDGDKRTSSFGDVNIIIQGGIDPNGLSVEDMSEKLGFEFEREVRTARGF